jgi:ABC-type Fe3+ transport system substrate-binding protein
MGIALKDQGAGGAAGRPAPACGRVCRCQARRRPRRPAPAPAPAPAPQGISSAARVAATAVGRAAEAAKDLAEDLTSFKALKDYRLAGHVASAGPRGTWRVFAAVSKKPGAAAGSTARAGRAGRRGRRGAAAAARPPPAPRRAALRSKE